jgi:hypothetical protein
MKSSIFTFIVILHTNLVFGQFTDNFSDRNFAANPAWNGDIGNFEVGSFSKLHLNNSIGNWELFTGMYIVWTEVFSNNGNAERFKEAIVLSR